MVPKRFLPLIAALIAADVEYDHIKLNSALLNALLQTIADWHRRRTGKDIEPKGRTGSVLRGRELLQEAAKTTEEELLATMREGFGLARNFRNAFLVAVAKTKTTLAQFAHEGIDLRSVFARFKGQRHAAG